MMQQFAIDKSINNYLFRFIYIKCLYIFNYIYGENVWQYFFIVYIIKLYTILKIVLRNY